jgi:putative proteasome-type protease
MTYCVAIQVDAGLVLAADTRTSAAFDDVQRHTKLHAFEIPGERVFVLLSAGNLGTTQGVLARLVRDIDDGASNSLHTVRHLFEAADYVGKVLLETQAQASGSATDRVSVEATLILAGQIGNGASGLHLIYPQGNWIVASPETPFLQSGELKYGKPILDRIVTPATALDDAARCALVSMDATIRSNVSVGLPIDLALIRAGDLRVSHRLRLDADTPLYAQISAAWASKLDAAVRSLPAFEWERAGTVPAQRALPERVATANLPNLQSAPQQ